MFDDGNMPSENRASDQPAEAVKSKTNVGGLDDRNFVDADAMLNKPSRKVRAQDKYTGNIGNPCQ
jgi:hypothetical protein